MRIMLVDDHRVVRLGLRALLEREGMEVVAEAANGHEALARAAHCRPDVVMMDMKMPELDGVETTRRLLAEYPAILVIGLSGSTDPVRVLELLDAGAVGYVLKSADDDELLSAIEIVREGRRYLSPRIAAELAEDDGYRPRAGEALPAPGEPDMP